jgi:hypothetical protein
MIPFLFIGGIGPKVAFIVGFTAAELMMHYLELKKIHGRFTFLVEEFTMVKLAP